jgi:hypothetical protein
MTMESTKVAAKPGVWKSKKREEAKYTICKRKCKNNCTTNTIRTNPITQYHMA